MGFAAVAAAEGRVAYVLYDRVQAAARLCQCAASDVMSVVVAHELGHLLLPRGDHSAVRIMRKQWHGAELRRMNRRPVRFTPAQAEQIRRRLWFVVGGLLP